MAVRTDSDANASPLTEVASGVDALYLSGRAALPDGLLRILRRHRQDAETVGTAVPVELAGRSFQLEPRGFGLYKFQLRDERGVMGLPRVWLTSLMPGVVGLEGCCDAQEVPAGVQA